MIFRAKTLQYCKLNDLGLEKEEMRVKRKKSFIISGVCICIPRNDPKFSDRLVWANSEDPDQAYSEDPDQAYSEDPDQTAPEGAF